MNFSFLILLGFGRVRISYKIDNNLVIDWVNAQSLAPRLTCIGDGHDGIWNIVCEFQPEKERREIQDLFHLMENLHKVGGSTKRINKAKALLWQGKVDETIASFANCNLKQALDFCAYLQGLIFAH